MKPPAFQFYVDDFLGGTMHFTDAEVGLYARLLCVQWSTGSLADDDCELGSYGKGRTPLIRIKAKFEKGQDGRLRNKRLETERQKQIDFRERQAENGKRGGRPPKEPNPNPSLSQPLSQTEAIKSSPVSGLLSPISASREAAAREGDRTMPDKLNTPVFRKAWETWIDHCGEKFHRAIPSATADSHLRICAELGANGAIEAIENAISKNLRQPSPPLMNGSRDSEPRRPERKGPMVVPMKQPGDLS